MGVKCRKCKVSMKEGEFLREHWERMHAVEKAEINRWLGEVEEKLKVARKLAREGMQGVWAGGRGQEK